MTQGETVEPTYELTPEIVQEYLDGFGDNQICAVRQGAASCPVSKALAAKYGESFIVGTTLWHLGELGDVPRGNFRSLPVWAIQFVQSVDSRKGKIRAKTAKRYLQEALAS